MLLLNLRNRSLGELRRIDGEGVRGIGSRIRGLQVRQRGRGKRIGDREGRLRVRGGGKGSEVTERWACLEERGELRLGRCWLKLVQVLLSTLAGLCLE